MLGIRNSGISQKKKRNFRKRPELSQRDSKEQIPAIPEKKRNFGNGIFFFFPLRIPNFPSPSKFPRHKYKKKNRERGESQINRADPGKSERLGDGGGGRGRKGGGGGVRGEKSGKSLGNSRISRIFKCPRSCRGCRSGRFSGAGRSSRPPARPAPAPASWPHSFCPTAGGGSAGGCSSSLSR